LNAYPEFRSPPVKKGQYRIRIQGHIECRSLLILILLDTDL
jgi:hypothetical protein